MSGLSKMQEVYKSEIMKVIELLKLNKDVIRILLEYNVDTNSIKYIEMYEDYLRLMNEGHKKYYVVSYLSGVYGISERTVFRAVKKLGRDVEV